jgi:hypothetical protein
MSDFCEVQSYTNVTSSVFGITEVDDERSFDKPKTYREAL